MAWRSAVRIELDEAERCELEARTRRRKISRADAMRAEIVPLAADGTTNLAIAEQLGVTRITVATWRSGSSPNGWTALPTSPALGPPARSGMRRSLKW
jgi:FixJ family two-component response regulator